MSNTQVAGLRALADIIEANLEIGERLAYSLKDVTAYSLPSDPEEQKQFLAKMIRIFKDAGFMIEKKYDDSSFQLICKFPDSDNERNTYESFAVRFYGSREAVCVPRVVGQKTTTRKIMPPSDTWEVKTETVDVIEWDCSPILGSTDD